MDSPKAIEPLSTTEDVAARRSSPVMSVAVGSRCSGARHALAKTTSPAANHSFMALPVARIILSGCSILERFGHAEPRSRP